MKCKALIGSLVLLSLLALSFAGKDDDPLQLLLNRLGKFRADFPQEKIHLHLDQPYYSIGDTIWFKAYLVNAENNLPASSTSMMVELINEKDSVKQSLLIPISKGTGEGDFTLPDSLREGNYRIRAYTPWMQNFGEDYFYDRTLNIGNALTNQVLAGVNFTFSKTGIRESVSAGIRYTDFAGAPLANSPVSYEVQLDARQLARGTGTTDADGKLTLNFVNNQPFILKSGAITTRITLAGNRQVVKIIPVKATLFAADIQFFPEGGHLVDSIRSTVAFKATAADGSGIAVSGYITDRANHHVAELVTYHEGMGTFQLIPLAGEKYTAHVQLPGGAEQLAELPASEKNGYVLTVANDGPEKLQVSVYASRTLRGTGNLTLIGQGHQVVQYQARLNTSGAVAVSSVPRSLFLPGIIQFTLFNGGQPVAERICFNRGAQPNISVVVNKAVKVNEKVNLQLELKNSRNAPAGGSFSVAVTDFSRVPADEEQEPSILSDLLLSSDIKGYIANPNYYFTSTSAEKDSRLDLLLLTQGWRRFTWKQLQEEQFPELAYAAENGITISGRVTTNSEKPVQNGRVSLLSTSGSAVQLDTLTGADGTFSFPHLRFADKTQFVVQARNAKGQKNVWIELDRPLQPFVTKNKNAPDLVVNIPAAQLTYLRARKDDFDELRKNGSLKNTILLSEVKLATVKENPAKNSSNLNGPGNADILITPAQLQGYNSLPQALDGHYAGLIIQNGMAYLTRSMLSSFTGASPMYLVVDGSSVGPGYLSSVSPRDIASIEVLKSPGNTAIYGMNGGAGVLIITTKRGQQNLDYSRLTEGITSYAPKGYYFAREFYVPASATAATGVSGITGPTIYWNPAVLPAADGKASLEFYTGATPGTYRVMVEGICADGTPARKVIYFTVK